MTDQNAGEDKTQEVNNSEMLFLYDAQRTNPNGDMDNENKPRMDWDTDTNLVSDVRLKRYVRDYLSKSKDKEIFVEPGKESAQDRIKDLGEDGSDLGFFDLVDVRLFGVVTTHEGLEDEDIPEDLPTHIWGPVQFTWGHSLNDVVFQDTETITSSFTGASSVGKDFRVKYSFLAFSGSINGNNAQRSRLSSDDVKLLDEAMINGLRAGRSHTKTGQTPRLYLRVEMSDDQYFLDDLREFVDLKENVPSKEIESIHDVELDISDLLDYLDKHSEKVKNVHYWKNYSLTLKCDGEKVDIEDELENKGLNPKSVEIQEG